jgi:hypothetical protein
MGSRVLLAVSLFLVVIAFPACASGSDGKIYDQQSIDALAARANQAEPREQYFLYAELVQQMTELSMRQYAAGEVDKTDELLKRIQQLTDKIHPSAAVDEKRLKNAEILLRHAAYRLKEMLHSSHPEDRPLVEQTLDQVNQAQSEAMLQVFRK